MSQRRALLASSISTIVCLAAFVSASPVQAYSADDFVDSIGVNTHFTDLTGVTSYAQYDLLRAKLFSLKIRHIRDAAHAYSNVTQEHPYYKRLRGLTGIRFTLVTNTRNDLKVIPNVCRWLKHRVEAFEGLNEPDISGGANWIENTRDWQTGLFDAIRENPISQGVPVIGPAVAWRKESLGSLDGVLNYGNIHTYGSGRSPREMSEGLVKLLTASRVNSGDNPVQITETGYHSAMLSTQQIPVPANIAAKYLPRLLMYFFKAGIKRSFLYELIDTRPNDNVDMETAFGLLNADGTVKPTFRAMKNLIYLLSDSTPKTAPRTLDYTVESISPDLETMLFQKNDGTFYLAFWLEQSSWDRMSRTEVPTKSVSIKVTFSEPVASCNLIKLTNSKIVANSFGIVNTATVKAMDAVQFLQITPG